MESVSLSPGGLLLASASVDKTVCLRDLTPLSDQRPWPERLAEAERQYHLRLEGLNLQPFGAKDNHRH